MKDNADLPFASTLCGSCSNVCPVKIDIHQQLYKWRQVLMQEGLGPTAKTMAMKGMALTLSKPGIYKTAGKAGRFVIKHFPFLVNNKLNAWYKQRNMPEPPKSSFGEWYRRNRGVGGWLGLMYEKRVSVIK
jgi:L-lactate dehydrogenase complex protein LldF